mgnify:CR=1 FL=1
MFPIHHLVKKVKMRFLIVLVKDAEVLTLVKIRSSVITHWLKNHNLRQVQYMAGHKYVSSTERYQQNNLEALQKNIEGYHPLNRTLSAI